jgi:REP element-mobilizing transposase RayT
MANAKTSFSHLRRLDHVWIEPPIYFVTTGAAVLANESAAKVIQEQFKQAPRRYGWRVGRYVVMPDHIHFFCGPGGERDPASLSVFVGGVKMWSARAILATTGRKPPLWQREFFDRLLRGDESYEGKWIYVRDNPVRAGLVAKAADWPFAGEIEALSR